MFSVRRLGYLDMDKGDTEPDEGTKLNTSEEVWKSQQRWWESFCLRFHQRDTTPSWQPRGWNSTCPFPLCPTYRQFAQSTCVLLFGLLIWGILFAGLGETATPGGQLFMMAFLVISAYLGGWIFLKLTTLPALIGMLAVGIIYQNVGLVHMTGVYVQLNSELRKVALVIILMRAGLGLDSSVLKKNFAAVLQLGLIPWVVECVLISISTHYLLGLPWIWGFLLGSMIASVSPAVVVPCLFRLREEGYGVAKGIPTLVLAAAGIDDSISVATFGIILSAMFSGSSTTMNIVKGPLSIVIGISAGTAWGALSSVLPERGDTYAVFLRTLSLLLFGLFAVFLSNLLGWGGAGPLAVVSCGFVSAIFWSKQGWPVNKNPVCTVFRIFWIVFEPILFAFTGAQVKIRELDPEVMKMGVLCLVGCLLLRLVATFLAGVGCGLNKKEKVFIGITWLSKATVQAALGPAALDMVLSGRSAGEPPDAEEHYARVLLAISVLSVVLAAPLGALLIAIAGPRLLARDTPQQDLVSSPENRADIALKTDDLSTVQVY